MRMNMSVTGNYVITRVNQNKNEIIELIFLVFHIYIY